LGHPRLDFFSRSIVGKILATFGEEEMSGAVRF
jgi:hypothetical protein